MKVQIFRFSTARVKIHQSFHVIFQTKCEFFFKVWITLQCQLFWTFLAEYLYAIDKGSASKCKFLHLPQLVLKFTKFIMSFFETKRQLSSNFAALSCVMKNNSSVLFHLKLYRLSKKETHQKQIFRLSTACMKINQIPCHFSNHKSVFT